MKQPDALMHRTDGFCMKDNSTQLIYNGCHCSQYFLPTFDSLLVFPSCSLQCRSGERSVGDSLVMRAAYRLCFWSLVTRSRALTMGMAVVCSASKAEGHQSCFLLYVVLGKFVVWGIVVSVYNIIVCPLMEHKNKLSTHL